MSGAQDERAGSRQTDEQRRALGGGGEGGRPEPKSREDWAERGAAGGAPGRSPPAPGGSSQGSGDRESSDRKDRDADLPTGRPPQPRPGEG